jgi:adenylosuccinate synthase
LKECIVEYIEMPGWDEDITRFQTFNELPQNCKNYVLKIEELIETQIKYIGVGVKRNEMIVRNSKVIPAPLHF